MKRNIFWQIAGVVFILILSGCAVRTYTVVKDRLDQDLTAGNKGYIMGGAPQTMKSKERKVTRTTYVVEIELPTLSKLKQKSKPVTEPAASKSAVATDQDLTAGNKGYIMGGAPQTPAVSKSAVATGAEKSEKTGQSAPKNFEKYKVINGDTLEKISKKFYGTTKKWVKIYEANKDKLKAPDKIYPGQIIDIPVENLKK